MTHRVGHAIVRRFGIRFEWRDPRKAGAWSPSTKRFASPRRRDQEAAYLQSLSEVRGLVIFDDAGRSAEASA